MLCSSQMAVITWFTSSDISLRNQWAYWILAVPMDWRCHKTADNVVYLGTCYNRPYTCLFFVLFFSCPRSKGWPHHGRTFSIYSCPLSFWLTLPRTVLATSWCCPSRPCVAFLVCVHLAFFLASSLSPSNSLVSSWCDHSMLASLLWRCLTVPSFVLCYCTINCD